MFGRIFAMASKAMFRGEEKYLTRGALKFVGRHAGSPWTNLGANVLLGAGIAYITAPQESKVKDTAAALVTSYLFMGFGPLGQILGPPILNGAMRSGQATKHIGDVIRSGGQSSMMAAIPFSSSPQGMDIANASFQFARQEMSKNYAAIGNEATLMASRYLTR